MRIFLHDFRGSCTEGQQGRRKLLQTAAEQNHHF